MRTSRQKLRERRWNATERSRMSQLTLKGPKNTERGFAQPHRLFEHCVEDGGKVAGRGVDDLQHLGGCGLLLQCLTRLGNESRVLHRNDRLRPEVFQQRNLLVGERAYLPPVASDQAEKGPIFAQR